MNNIYISDRSSSKRFNLYLHTWIYTFIYVREYIYNSPRHVGSTFPATRIHLPPAPPPPYALSLAAAGQTSEPAPLQFWCVNTLQHIMLGRAKPTLKTITNTHTNYLWQGACVCDRAIQNEIAREKGREGAGEGSLVDEIVWTCVHPFGYTIFFRWNTSMKVIFCMWQISVS